MLAHEVRQEELVFQLANIGGYTAPPRTTISSDTTVTPGSSRSRKWSQGRFQKMGKPKSQPHYPQISPSSYLMERKTSEGKWHSQETPYFVSNTPSTPCSRSLSLLEVPLRSTSIPHSEVKSEKPTLPRSTSVPQDGWRCALPSSANGTPPRVKPFDQPNHARNKKSYVNEPCCLCQEFISCRAMGEKVIALECGHLTHEGCLMAYFEKASASPSVMDMFPVCRECDESVRCIPSEPDLRDQCISRILMRGSPLRKTFTNVDPKPLVPEQYVVNPPNVVPLGLGKSQYGVFRRTSSSKKNVKELSLQLTPFSSSTNANARGSIVSGISSIVSSVPTRNSSDAEDGSRSSTLGSAPTMPLTVLRSFYSHKLLESFPENLRSWELDSKFGLLRIVDRLMFSEDGKTYHDSCCYLFTDALLIALVSPTFDPRTPAGMRFDKFLIHHPLSSVSVDSLNSSVLKCTILSAMKNSKIMQGSTFYLTESLDSDKSQVVEKWISALLNQGIVFKSSNFSSTLPPLPVTTNPFSSRLTVRRTGRKSSDMDFEDELNDTDIIVRNSIVFPDGKSRRTTITSLLSLQRDRPKNLAIVLQVNATNLKDADFLALINSLRALIMNMKETQMCLVDSSGGVIDQGLAEKLLVLLQNLKDASHKFTADHRPRFSPTQFKDACCSKMTDKVGIVVLSNTSVEDGKSCLLMDYKVFSSTNRNRPHELKVHVGFLNVDYTDQISELVEVSSFQSILETVSYGFNLTFGEDDDDFDDDDDDESDADEDTNDHEKDSTPELTSRNLGTHNGWGIEETNDRNVEDEDHNSDLVDYNAYRESLCSTLSSPLSPSNRTLCEASCTYSSSSKNTSQICGPGSTGSSFYSPIRIRDPNSQGAPQDDFTTRRSAIRSLQLEGESSYSKCESPMFPSLAARAQDFPGWSRFVEGFNKVVDEAIDCQVETSDGKKLSVLGQSNYGYM
ncbi:LAFA_0E06040g1_1 [Lachancea sp. 'fantastica']|nr:LAFA_0E06040g1_1 [Lachancea sp. 'fantastica']